MSWSISLLAAHAVSSDTLDIFSDPIEASHEDFGQALGMLEKKVYQPSPQVDVKCILRIYGTAD